MWNTRWAGELNRWGHEGPKLANPNIAVKNVFSSYRLGDILPAFRSASSKAHRHIDSKPGRPY